MASTSATTSCGTGGSRSKTLDDARPRYTEAVLEHNRLIAEDERYLSTIVPTRDGVMVAIRIG